MKKKKKKLLIALAVILLIFFLLGGGAYYVFNHYYSNSNFVKDDEVAINYDYLKQLAAEEQIALESDALAEGYEGETAAASEAETEGNALSEAATEAQTETDMAAVQQVSKEQAEGTYNLLLIGVDRRSDDWYGNSDAMILATVNHNVKKIFLTSFMRDLYADIPGFGVMKLNAAHAIGGGPLLVETLEKNYGVVIDNYARVDFTALADIIDILGGVDIEMSEAEVNVANGYITDMCNQQNKAAEDYTISGSGMMHLNGMQAVAYSRIRYVGNADYERTERQREVLTTLMSGISELSLGELNDLINEILPLVTHNVDQTTMLGLLSQVQALMSYEVVTDRVPYDGMYTSRNELLIPDMEDTVARLQETIYAGD